MFPHCPDVAGTVAQPTLPGRGSVLPAVQVSGPAPARFAARSRRTLQRDSVINAELDSRTAADSPPCRVRATTQNEIAPLRGRPLFAQLGAPTEERRYRIKSLLLLC